MFEHIIVAVDGSDCAKRAAAFGLALADQYGASVDAVHVSEGRVEGADADVPDVDARAPLADVEAHRDAAGFDCPLETHLLEGRPHRAIADHAAESGADLLVMGTHGRHGVGERLLGTVTDRVLRRSRVPVLAVPEGSLDALAVDDVLLTTDGSENSERAAPYGDSVASEFGATLHLLSVVDVQGAAGVFDAGGVSGEFVARLEERARDAVERLAGRVDAADVESAVTRGVPHRAIGEYAAQNGVDLIVMASEGESNLAGQYLGSVTDRVLRTAGVPVLVV